MSIISPDQLKRPVPITEEEAQALRAKAVHLVGEQKFTCDDCPARLSCTLSYDAYNTNGDCLAEK